MIGRLKKLAVVLLSGVIWTGAHMNASAATIDLEALGLIADPTAFFTETGTGLSRVDSGQYSYTPGVFGPFVFVGLGSQPGVGDRDFSLGLVGISGGTLSAASEVVMSSAPSIDILFSIDPNFNTLGISGSHILASITHNDDQFSPGASIFSQPTIDRFASIALTSVAPIPLPMGIVLLLSSLGGLILVRRRIA